MTGPQGRVRVSVDRSVMFVEMDRPPLNVLDLGMLGGIADAVARAAADPSLCALVIRGAGERAFSAGVELSDHRPDAARAMLRAVHGVVLGLVRAPLVTVAAVRGFCLGGGLELAVSCDLLIAEDGATFGQPEVKVGCFPPVACATLASLVGRAPAADMILTGQPVTTARAAELRLLSRIGPLDRTTEEVLGHLRGLSRLVLRSAVEALRGRDARSLEERLAENETIYERRLLASFDLNEGIDAFLEKRAPRWRHE
jgi:cyclohexa-1,5-dienecarbonyl-CoA hydratase